MIKTIKNKVFCYDMEWIPDPRAAEILYDVPAEASEEEKMKTIWQNHIKYDAEEETQPYTKTIMSRIISCSGVLREQTPNGVELSLITLHGNEKSIIKRLLGAIGQSSPQLVGFNNIKSDWPIMLQRAIVHGLCGQGVGTRPDKPWEGVDYYSGDYNIDLLHCLAERSYPIPSFHEFAVLCGIPGKIDASGGRVAQMYIDGRYDEIIEYNEFDALSTHLLWLRCVRFANLITEVDFIDEQILVEELLEREIANGKTHLKKFENEWSRLHSLNSGV
jgi:predicted PolB exonuclease-like 3'-5' exonuclease